MTSNIKTEPAARLTTADVDATPAEALRYYRDQAASQTEELVMVTVRWAGEPSDLQRMNRGDVIQVGDDLFLELRRPVYMTATPTTITGTFLGVRLDPANPAPEFPPAVKAVLESRRDQLAGRIRALRSEADGLVQEANRALSEVNCLEPQYRQLRDFLNGQTGSTLEPDERERLKEGRWRCPHSDGADGPRCEKEVGHSGLHKMGSSYLVNARAEERDGEIKFVCTYCGHAPHDGRKCAHPLQGIAPDEVYCECKGEEA